MLDVLIDKDLKFSDFGLCLVDRPAIPVAEEDVTIHDTIDRFDGGLIERGPLLNRPLKLTVNYLDDEPAKRVLRQFRGALLNKGLFELRFSDELDICYRVKKVTMGDIANEIDLKGEFDLDLIIDPLDYALDYKRISGDNSVTVDNKGTYIALPIIEVTGTGDVVIKAGETSLTISSLRGTAVIDSELKDFYNKSKPSVRDLKVHCRSFPELPLGASQIMATGAVTKLEVRWRERYR